MTPSRKSIGIPLAAVLGGLAFSFMLLAFAELADPGLHRWHGVWPSLGGACSGLFGALLIGGIWRLR